MGQNKTELVETLLEADVLKYNEVTEAAQFPGGGSLVEKALSMGFGNENDVLKILINRMSLATIEGNELSNISQEVLHKLPQDVILRHHIIPFFTDSVILNVAMIDPTDDSCLNEIAFFTELMIFPYGVQASKLTKALNKYFGMGLPEIFTHRSAIKPAAEATVIGIPESLPPKPKSMPKPNLPPKPNMPPLPPEKGKTTQQQPNLPPRPAQAGAASAMPPLPSLSNEKINDEKSVIVDALKQQKEALEEDFNKRLEEMKKRFSKLEKDKKIDKLKEELEERLEIKRTMDKLNEMEHMRYMSGQPYMPPQYYNMPPNMQPYQYPPQQQAVAPDKNDQNDKNNELAIMLSKQIEELKQQMMELSKIAAEKAASVVQATAVCPPAAVEAPAAPPPKCPPVDNNDDSGIPDIDNIVNDMKSSPIAEEVVNEFPVSSKMIDVSDILNGKDKDSVLSAVITEMKKISKRSIILFVKYENLVGVTGFGQYISERVQNYTTTIILPGIFKKIYDSKKPIHGQTEFNDLTKKFLDYFGGIRPDKMTLVPAILKNRVFAMIYAEEADPLDSVIKIADAMSEAFSNLLSKR